MPSPNQQFKHPTVLRQWMNDFLSRASQYESHHVCLFAVGGYPLKLLTATINGQPFSAEALNDIDLVSNISLTTLWKIKQAQGMSQGIFQAHMKGIKIQFEKNGAGESLPVITESLQDHWNYVETHALSQESAHLTRFELSFNPQLTTDCQADANERDLTLNAFYLDSTGKLTDPFNGLEDFTHKRIQLIPKTIIEEEEMAYDEHELCYGPPRMVQNTQTSPLVNVFDKPFHIVRVILTAAKLTTIVEGKITGPHLTPKTQDTLKEILLLNYTGRATTIQTMEAKLNFRLHAALHYLRPETFSILQSLLTLPLEGTSPSLLPPAVLFMFQQIFIKSALKDSSLPAHRANGTERLKSLYRHINDEFFGRYPAAKVIESLSQNKKDHPVLKDYCQAVRRIFAKDKTCCSTSLLGLFPIETFFNTSAFDKLYHIAELEDEAALLTEYLALYLLLPKERHCTDSPRFFASITAEQTTQTICSIVRKRLDTSWCQELTRQYEALFNRFIKVSTPQDSLNALFQLSENLMNYLEQEQYFFGTENLVDFISHIFATTLRHHQDSEPLIIAKLKTLIEHPGYQKFQSTTCYRQSYLSLQKLVEKQGDVADKTDSVDFATSGLVTPAYHSQKPSEKTTLSHPSSVEKNTNTSDRPSIIMGRVF